jgi:hypothetical protein
MELQVGLQLIFFLVATKDFYSFKWGCNSQYLSIMNCKIGCNQDFSVASKVYVVLHKIEQILSFFKNGTIICHTLVLLFSLFRNLCRLGYGNIWSQSCRARWGSNRLCYSFTWNHLC